MEKGRRENRWKKKERKKEQRRREKKKEWRGKIKLHNYKMLE